MPDLRGAAAALVRGAAAALVAACAWACAAEPVVEAEPVTPDPLEDAGPSAPAVDPPGWRAHTFPAIPGAALGAAGPICQSWSLENDAPLYLSRARVDVEGAAALAGALWFFVPADAHALPAGTWPCARAGFDEVVATTAGGLLAALPAGARKAVLPVPAGTAVRLPPRSQVVGLLWLSDAQGATGSIARAAVALETARRTDARLLAPASFRYDSARIPPHARSRFTMDCDVGSPSRETLGHPARFAIPVWLPRLHPLGTRLAVERVGGADDGTTMLSAGTATDPLLVAGDPAAAAADAEALRIACDFSSRESEHVDTDARARPLCLVHAYTDAPFRMHAHSGASRPSGVDSDGVRHHKAPCVMDVSRAL